MKKKFILMTTIGVMLLAMLCAFAVPVSAEPVMTPEPVSAASETIAAADTADLAVMSNEALMIDNSAPALAPALATGETSIWLAPVVTPIATMAGGPNKFI